MAIQTAWQSPSGLQVSSAYFRIEHVSVDARLWSVTIRVKAFKDKPSSDANKRSLDDGMDFSIRDADGQTHFTDYFLNAVADPGETLLSLARRKAYEYLMAERAEFVGASAV